MASYHPCKDGALSVKPDYPVEVALEHQLMRSVSERVRESFRVDIQIVAEQASKQSIRSHVADRWLILLTRFLRENQPGTSLDAALSDVESAVFFELGMASPGQGGTPFAISNS